MKLIGVDVDGTLVNSKRVITEKTREALISAMKAGHKVVIVTGRPTAGARNLAEALDFDKYGGLISSFNGGAITDFATGKVLANHEMDHDLAVEMIKLAKDLPLETMVPYMDTVFSPKIGPYTEGEAKTLRMKAKEVEDLDQTIDFPVNKILFAADPRLIDEPTNKIKEAFEDVTEQVKSARFYYEVMPRGLSKGNSLLEIAKIFNIDQKDIIAFGDEMNDETMIEAAGVGVAMGNAVSKIKEIADYVTLTNDEDGIAYYLDKFLL